MLPQYQIVVRDKQGNELGEFTDWRGLSFSDHVNNYGTAEFQVPLSSQNLLELVALRQYETLIKRNGAIIWAGEQADRFGTLEVNSANWITIVSHSFLEMFNSAYTAPYVRYEGVDEGQIIKNLVDDFQALTGGDHGFTFGTYLTGVLRDREYSNQNIMEAIINLTELINGADVYITFDKEINVVSHQGVDKSRHTILEWGTNIESVTVNESFTNPCNEAIVLGAGFGAEQLVSTYTDTDFRDIYGLRQQRASEIDVSIEDTLDAKAEALVRKFKQPLITIDLKQLASTTPVLGTISMGDTIKVKIDEGIFDINNKFRVYSRNVSVDDNGKESISYVIGQI